MSSYVSLLWSQLSYIFWREGSVPTEKSTPIANDGGTNDTVKSDDLEDLGTWEWFLSPTEREILRQLSLNSNIINEELSVLRRTNQSFSARKRILSRIQDTLSHLNPDDIAILLKSRIPLTNQTSIFRNLFKVLAE